MSPRRPGQVYPYSHHWLVWEVYQQGRNPLPTSGEMQWPDRDRAA